MNMPMFLLRDRVAIITGGGRGIGKAIALGFAQAGAHVVVAARTVSELQAVASEVTERGGKALAVPTDVTQADQVSNMVRATLAEFGRIDILVNNAGGFTGDKRTFLQHLSKEEWEGLLPLELTSVFLCSTAVFPTMKQQKKGSIINISSMITLSPIAGAAHYGAAKAAVNHFSRTAALEWARYNVRVNVITPGFNDVGKYPYDERMVVQVPLGRLGQPEDIVGGAIFLASDASSYITGAIIPVTGGA